MRLPPHRFPMSAGCYGVEAPAPIWLRAVVTAGAPDALRYRRSSRPAKAARGWRATRMSRILGIIVAAVVAAVATAGGAAAQSYPTRAVKFILPFGAGSGTDITARLIGDRLAARWGK